MPGSPWDADERDFPEKGGVEERLRFLLNLKPPETVSRHARSSVILGM